MPKPHDMMSKVPEKNLRTVRETLVGRMREFFTFFDEKINISLRTFRWTRDVCTDGSQSSSIPLERIRVAFQK